MNWTGKVKQLCFTPDVDISDDVDHLDFHSPDTYVLMLPMLNLKFSKMALVVDARSAVKKC